MLPLVVTGVVVTAVSAAPRFSITIVFEVLGVLGAVGAFIGAVVAVYKARSEKDWNSAQMLGLLFEKQREQNLDLIAERDKEIVRLERALRHANGQQEQLREQLDSCIRERLVLLNQVAGLEATLAEVRRRPRP